MSKVRELFHQYRDVEALHLLKETLDSDGANADVALQLVRAHRRLGDLQAAGDLINVAAKLGADGEQLGLERKLLSVQAGQIRGFDKEFTKLIVDSPDNGPDILQAYVLGLFANLRTDEAFGLLSGWQQSSPSDSLPHFLEAYLLHGINRLQPAADAYRKGLQLAPYMTLMRRRLAQVLYESGEYKAALIELDICVAQGDLIESHALIARCAHAENDFVKAMAELKVVLDTDPNHLDGRRLRGQIHLSNNELPDALEDLEFVVQRNPDDLVATEALARTLQGLGRSVEARKRFDEVSSATKEQAEIGRLIHRVFDEPQNAELRFEIGDLLLKSGSLREGAKWLRTVLEIDPNHAAAIAALRSATNRDSNAAGEPTSPNH
jgi:tetratricopeptide (TPR) repeat protein